MQSFYTPIILFYNKCELKVVIQLLMEIYLNSIRLKNKIVRMELAVNAEYVPYGVPTCIAISKQCFSRSYFYMCNKPSNLFIMFCIIV